MYATGKQFRNGKNPTKRVNSIGEAAVQRVKTQAEEYTVGKQLSGG